MGSGGILDEVIAGGTRAAGVDQEAARLLARARRPQRSKLDGVAARIGVVHGDGHFGALDLPLARLPHHFLRVELFQPGRSGGNDRRIGFGGGRLRRVLAAAVEEAARGQDHGQDQGTRGADGDRQGPVACGQGAGSHRVSLEGWIRLAAMDSMVSSGATLVVVMRSRALLMASIRASVDSGVLREANSSSSLLNSTLTSSTAFPSWMTSTSR